MDKKEDKIKKTAQEIAAEEQYPGAAIDAADDDREDARLAAERTATLNCNPRNDN